MSNLSQEEIKIRMSDLHDNWEIDNATNELVRKFTFKNYSSGVKIANEAAQLCEQQNHHADICFGWGYCTIRMHTHSTNGLTKLDFELALDIDKSIEI